MHRATRRAPDAATFQPGDRRRGSSRRRRLTLAIGAAVTSAVATAAVSTALAAAPTSGPGSVVPAQDPFYTAPANIASYAPGQIVASRAVTLSLSTPSNAWQISYRSDDSHGNPEMAVTTLVVPTAPWTGLGTRPAVSYEIAEDSTGTQCAPSYQMASTGGAGEDLDLNTMLSNGWAVQDPDYEGPGSQWMAGVQAGHAVLDGIRAADSFLPGGLSSSTRWGLDGYSGGANATGWAAQLQPTYAPALHLVGVAMGGTPADPKAVATYLDGGLFSGFEFAAAWGISQAYPEANIPSLLNAKGEAAFTKIGGGECLLSILSAFPLKQIANYANVSDPLDVPSVAAVLAEDTLGNAKPTSAPIYDYHANTDEVVPVAQDNTLVQNWCARGASVDKVRDLIGEHGLEAVLRLGDTETFLTDRFLGEPAANSC